MILFPLASLFFYYTIAFIFDDWILALNITIVFSITTPTAIYSSKVERVASFEKKTNLAWLLAFECVLCALFIGCFSAEAYP